MFDLRPVAYVIGLLLLFLGAAMLVPMALDLWAGDPHWQVFLGGAVITALTGGTLALATSNGVGPRMTVQQS